MKDITDYIIYELEGDQKPQPTVTVFADLNYDYIYSAPPLQADREVMIKDFSRNLAGAGGYVSSGLAKLGAQVFLLTELGDDAEGNLLYHEIEEYGVEVSGISLVKGKHSPFTLIFTDNGEETPRQVATYPGTSLDLNTDSIDYRKYVAQSDLVYSCNYFILRRLREEIKFVFRFAREKGVCTSYDANAGDEWGSRESLDTLLHRIYPLTDVIFLNENEAGYVAESDDLEGEITSICPEATTVVIKLGVRGTLVRHRNRIYRCTAFPLKDPVRDTVGAGDSFQAAFLYFYLKKYAIELCMILGSANAASTVQYRGGTEGQRDVKGIIRFIRGFRIKDEGRGALSIERIPQRGLRQ
jgi:sugar/nucleoside kinase (ribokinase family)